MFCDVVEICGAQVPLRGGGKTGRILRAVRLVSGLPWVRALLQPKPDSPLHGADSHKRDSV